MTFKTRTEYNQIVSVRTEGELEDVLVKTLPLVHIEMHRVTGLSRVTSQYRSVDGKNKSSQLT